MSRDYMKEIGNRSASPRVPLPLAIAVLAIGGAALWFGAMKVREMPSTKHVAETAPAMAGKPAVQAHGMQR
jgi:hypothetical protein